MRAGEIRWRSPVVILAVVSLLVVVAALIRPFARDAWRRHQLAHNLGTRDPARRLGAAIGLGRMGDARAVPVLLGALTEPDDVVARPEDSVAALCAIGAGSVPALAAALDRTSSDPSRLAEALACIDDPTARAALARFLTAAAPERLGAVVSVLSSARDPRIIALLAAAAGAGDPARRLHIVTSLSAAQGGLPDPRLQKLLTDAAQDRNPSVRAAAIGTIQWNRLNAPGSIGEWGAPSGGAAAAGLASAADRARAFLARRQDRAGFWRTSATNKPNFARGFREKNTYLTPMIVDLLAPVVDEAQLGGMLAGARGQIAAEVEDNGLVRYYGKTARRDDPQRGCVISYDADDTVLAWRVAPLPDRARLRSALTTLSRFRAPNGLFQTWLALPGALQCVNRGSNPNPTDVGIQMHIIMLMAKADPAGAQALCDALRQNIGDERIWVYYRREPLIPLIRAGELDRAGCSLAIPAGHRQTGFPGQGMWLAAAHALSRPSASAPGGPDRDATLALLQRLAKDDFQAIRRSPPLLYQNDASASIPAFYWSQEYGFALWLRLYGDVMRAAR